MIPTKRDDPTSSSSEDEEEWDEIKIDKPTVNPSTELTITIPTGPSLSDSQKMTKQNLLLLHQACLVALLATCLFRNRMSLSQEFQARIYSQIGWDVNSNLTKTNVQKLLQRWIEMFPIKEGIQTEISLENPILDSSGLSREASVLYFITLLRILSFPCRLGISYCL
jgi:hypothetical protein